MGIRTIPTIGAMLLLACPWITQGQSVSDTQSRNKAAVERAFAAWTDGSGSPFNLLAERAHWTIPGHSVAAKTYPNREAFMAEVIRPFNARMKTMLKPTIRSIYTSGDTVVILFDAEGTALDGISYRNNYAWFLDMKEGQIVNAIAFFDSMAFNDLWRRVTPAQP